VIGSTVISLRYVFDIWRSLLIDTRVSVYLWSLGKRPSDLIDPNEYMLHRSFGAALIYNFGYSGGRNRKYFSAAELNA
jgi:hypothetical protein